MGLPVAPAVVIARLSAIAVAGLVVGQHHCVHRLVNVPKGLGNLLEKYQLDSGAAQCPRAGRLESTRENVRMTGNGSLDHVPNSPSRVAPKSTRESTPPGEGGSTACNPHSLSIEGD